MKAKLGIYTSHDANLCAYVDGLYFVVEAERLTSRRYHSLLNDLDWESTLTRMIEALKKQGIDAFETTAYGEVYNNKFLSILQKHCGITNFCNVAHHYSHAACGFYQSPYERAIVMSFDGGALENGRIVYWQFFRGDKTERSLIPLGEIPIDMGTSYLYSALPICEIRKSANWLEGLNTYAGKLMGLSAYGSPDLVQTKLLKQFYLKARSFTLNDLEQIGLPAEINTVSGRQGFDLAASNQRVFEEIAWEHLAKCLEETSLNQVVVTGGCALNVLFNQKLQDRIGGNNVFVPPNPNDCGLAFGSLAAILKPRDPATITYCGLPFQNNVAVNGPTIDAATIAKFLAEGRIIGLVQGNSEVGPRALGNRSILCDPGAAGIKDTLNAKVKFREWFRPFAPVVQYENAGKYFEMKGESPYMSFAQTVKRDAVAMIPAVVHEDQTARVQTVRRTQNPLLYDILQHFASRRPYGLLLNTSFNSKGKPLVNSMDEVLENVRTTALDMAIVNGCLIQK